MFPYRLVGDNESVEIDVVKALRNEIPTYLLWLEQGTVDEPSKFAYHDIDHVDIMTVDTSVDSLTDIDIWGVGLRVSLSSGKYFVVYLPMQDECAHEEVFLYWSEIMASIDIVDANTDVHQLSQMRVWRSNLFRYTDDCETLVLTKKDLGVDVKFRM